MEFLRFLLEERPKQPIKHPIGGDVSVLILERKKKRDVFVCLLLLAR